MTNNPKIAVVSQLRKILIDLKEAWPRIQTEIHGRNSKDKEEATAFEARLIICLQSTADMNDGRKWIEALVADTLASLTDLVGLYKLDQYKTLIFPSEAWQLQLTPKTWDIAGMGIEIRYALAAIQIATANREGSGCTLSATIFQLLPGAVDNGIKFCDRMIEEFESSPF